MEPEHVPVTWKLKFYVNSYVNFSHQQVNLMSHEIQTSVICGCMWKPPMLSIHWFVVVLSEQLLPLNPGPIRSSQRPSGEGASAHLFLCDWLPSLRTAYLVLVSSLRISGSGCRLVERIWLRTRIWLSRRRFFKPYRDTHVYKVTVYCHVQG